MLLQAAGATGAVGSAGIREKEANAGRLAGERSDEPEDPLGAGVEATPLSEQQLAEHVACGARDERLRREQAVGGGALRGPHLVQQAVHLFRDALVHHSAFACARRRSRRLAVLKWELG